MKSENRFVCEMIDSPVGQLFLSVEESGRLAKLYFGSPDWQLKDGETWGSHPALDIVKGQLSEFFSRKRTRFEVNLMPQGTEFQRQVWSYLQTIPYGETRSYGQLAEALNKKGASRAVGRANGSNPVSIIVPCHRVIGANGSLTGFGGGLEIKSKLLALEQGSLFGD